MQKLNYVPNLARAVPWRQQQYALGGGLPTCCTDEGGASGFIAGRSVWREVVSLVGQQREEFLTSVALHD